MRRLSIAITALFLLVSCSTTSSLVELRQAPPSADPYHAALAGRYQQFAEEKVAAYDWWTSKYFADKGLMAAYGRDVGPEDPTQWSPDESAMDDLQAAHARLRAALPAAREAVPLDAAAAVVAYDRWLELADDRWNTARISAARDTFYAALNTISGTPHTLADDDVSADVVESTSAVLYFPFDSDVLTPNTQAALDEMVAYIKAAGPTSVAINGHADRAGSDDYNMQLSERRAKLVMDALKAAGVPASGMQYYAFGETDPKVTTDDGVEEPHNRRVEIFLE